MKYKYYLTRLITGLAIVLMLSGCTANPLTQSKSNQGNSSQQTSQRISSRSSNNSASNTNIGGLTLAQETQLAQLNYQPGTSAIKQVNNDKSTLNPSSWQTNKVIYSPLDHLNRTSSPNTGFLEARNHANQSLRVQQTVEPTGWHYNHGDKQIYNRGHMIAYSVSAGISQDGSYNPNSTSGDQNNPKNLFTQSAFSNQELQTIYEQKVREAIEQNKKVIYQVTPIFRGNELMARGVNLQAISTDSSLNFNVYIFNVQPGYQFNYANGSAKVDSSMYIPTPANAPHFNDNNQQGSGQQSFSNSQYGNSSYGHRILRNYQNIHHNWQALHHFTH